MHCLDGLVNLRFATRETMFNYFQLIDTKSLQEKISKGGFPFSKYLFWDAPIENIDIEKNKKYIIERVVTRGFLEDFYILTQLYSRDQIVESLKRSRELDPKTVNFCSLYFHVPKSDLNVSLFHR